MKTGIDEVTVRGAGDQLQPGAAALPLEPALVRWSSGWWREACKSNPNMTPFVHELIARAQCAVPDFRLWGRPGNAGAPHLPIDAAALQLPDYEAEPKLREANALRRSDELLYLDVLVEPLSASLRITLATFAALTPDEATYFDSITDRGRSGPRSSAGFWFMVSRGRVKRDIAASSLEQEIRLVTEHAEEFGEMPVSGVSEDTVRRTLKTFEREGWSVTCPPGIEGDTPAQ